MSLDVGTAFPYVGSLAWRVRALLIECCRVAMSNVRGDGVSRKVVQSSFKISRHLGAIGRSQSGMMLMLRLSLS